MSGKDFDRAENKAKKRLVREARKAKEARQTFEAFDIVADERDDADFLGRETYAEFLQNSRLTR